MFSQPVQGEKNENFSLPQNCVETSSLAQFLLRILGILLVFENSSIWDKNEGPCFLARLGQKDENFSQSQNCVETSYHAQFLMRIQGIWLVLEIHPFGPKTRALVPWPVQGKKNESFLLSQNSVETSYLAQFLMRIQGIWLVFENSSFWAKNEGPCTLACLGQEE